MSCVGGSRVAVGAPLPQRNACPNVFVYNRVSLSLSLDFSFPQISSQDKLIDRGTFAEKKTGFRASAGITGSAIVTSA